MPNIFLSHCSEDKGLIDTIAQKLLIYFSKEEIFYDAWSMQPGDNFLNGMEKGLENCEYFFLFMSETSIRKPMVRLEWHSALLENLKGNKQFIPVRVDNISPPALLTSTLYIDMYNRGINQTIKDIVQVANGGSTYNPTAISPFNNLEVKVNKNGSNVNICISAKRLTEPDNSFAFWVSDGSKPSIFGMSSSGSSTLEDGRLVYIVEQSHTITPNKPSNFFLRPTQFPLGMEAFQVLGNKLVSLYRGTIN